VVAASRLDSLIAVDASASSATRAALVLRRELRAGTRRRLSREVDATPEGLLATAIAVVHAALVGDDHAPFALIAAKDVLYGGVRVRPHEHDFAMLARDVTDSIGSTRTDASFAVAAEDVPDIGDARCACPIVFAWSREGIVLRADGGRDPAGARALLDAVARVLVGVARRPRSPVAAFDVLGSTARRTLGRWGRPVDDPRAVDDSIVSRFDAQCVLAPDSIAIDGDATRLRYAELAEVSRRLAACLVDAGVVAGDIVAIAAPRGALAVACMLAVLRVRAAYMPIDPSLPEDRIAFMLADSRARIVLADLDVPLAARGSTVIDARVSLAARDPIDGIDRPPAPASEADAAAYVMYTSGTTGQPKGVVVPQRGIVRLVTDARYLTLGPGRAMLHAAPLGFDASTLEIWGPLLNGGRVVVHGESPPTCRGLSAAISAHGVESAWLTSALFNALVRQDASCLQGLSTLLVGGEALDVASIRRALAALPRTTLVNGYGPTETTTFATTYPIPRDLPESIGSIPIGRPIARTTLRVVGQNGRLLPPGLVGELWIGGDGVALGYLNRPELTAACFVAVTDRDATDRFYRTGDRVCWSADGTLRFIGRDDRQLKIRGFRIEPSEIESAITRRPDVGAAAVVADAGADGTARLVAYLVATGDELDLASVRTSLQAALPAYMVPSVFVRVDALPINANGKLDRTALPAPPRARPPMREPYVEPEAGLERRFADAFERTLGIDGVGALDSFFDLGGTSLSVLAAVDHLERDHGLSVAPQWFFGDPTPRGIASALRQAEVPDARVAPEVRVEPEVRPDAPEPRAGCDEPIAIVGMAVRLPGASDLESFWANLAQGRESITFFDVEALDPSIADEASGDPSYVRARGVIDGFDRFDAAFFGITPREAELLDPQQRVFLELSWECLERAGHVPRADGPSIGVFAGAYNATYYQHHVRAHPERVSTYGAFQTMLANEKDYVATRVAHRLDLDGPAVNVFTACSTSLVAVAQAVDALRAGRCGLALAGGVAITCPPMSGYRHEPGSMLSPDGHTRTFSEDAAGTVFSDGAGVLLLRPLSEALRDGDTIHALIRSVAVNNDGAAKASFSAPSVRGQARVIAEAHRLAGVAPDRIDYIEAHGTATPLGDPVEIQALSEAFGDAPQARRCLIGSVKSNIGHTVMAAGAAGVVKVALAMKHELLPATLHFERPNPHLDLPSTPFSVVDRPTPWPRTATPRLAGVSAFGVGGTNAHAVIEEPPEAVAPTEVEGASHVLRLSARSQDALARMSMRLADHLEAHPGLSLADAAHTLRVGRRTFLHRIAIAASTTAEAVEALRHADVAALADGVGPARTRRVAFLFPGQGAQYPRMGLGLARLEPDFAQAFDTCIAACEAAGVSDLRTALHDPDEGALQPTRLTQPALFCVEVALARMWLARGVTPAMLVGHSIGEFAAAVIAGVMSLEHAALAVVRRAALMQSMPTGRMVAVRAAADAVAPRLPPGVDIAAINADGACVLSGPDELIERAVVVLESAGVSGRTLRTSHAFHSGMMEPAVAAFERCMADIVLSAPRVPIVSTVTGRVLTDAQAVDPAFWARQLRATVRFSEAIGALGSDPDAGQVLLECGPRATLTAFSMQHPRVRDLRTAAVASLSAAEQAETAAVAAATARLWTLGLDVAERLASPRRRIELPTYPFERTRFWLDAAPARTPATPPREPRLEPSQPETSRTATAPPAVHMNASPSPRTPDIVDRLRALLEDLSGLELSGADPSLPFVELGIDSLVLTQLALQVRTTFGVSVTFRDIVERHRSLAALSRHVASSMPAGTPAPTDGPAPSAVPAVSVASASPLPAVLQPARTDPASPLRSQLERLIEQQLDVMRQQLALLRTDPPAEAPPPAPRAEPTVATSGPAAQEDVERATMQRYDVRKAFGAIARIHTTSIDGLSAAQRARLDAFVHRYAARTARSKAYTSQHRSHLADPRVVNGFRPALKEIVYQIVMERSAGARLWDLDGNQYVDALNGFGMSLFGWQPDFVLKAVKGQIDRGFDIGPQHPLAGPVAERICGLTGFDRAALCNTGSEAVMGCVRIARTVTGRSLIAVFSGSYHGIFDEAIVRGTRRMTAVPAAPGIMPSAAQNVVVLEYGTDESLQWLTAHASELAAVIVEPVQSRRPDLQPREFVRQLRALTESAGTLLVFDEVVTGFRCHPGGIQALWGVRADLASYGKVLGGGFPIGVIAGRREFIDALDGGHWTFGDDSIPTVGVTYFAGTFVRHPLALAATHAVLEHLEREGPELQAALTRSTGAMVDELNAFCREEGAPITLKSFSSVWKIVFDEDHPLQDLLFAMMRDRGVHILDNFPCFMTTAHGAHDIATIKTAFKEAVSELQASDFLPRRATSQTAAFDAARPPVPGARLGRDPDGRPAWYVSSPNTPGKFIRLDTR
jgi:amino acid adenylation domain-containing protein